MKRSVVSRAVLLVFCALALASCRETPPPKKYELVGQILAIKPERNEVTIKHEDVKGFMPGMTMPFKVEEPALLIGRKPGDLITAILVVGEVDAHLESLNVTGHRELDAPPPPELPTILEPGQPVVDAPLINQNGAAVPMSSLRGHRVALTFLYTRCPLPDYCPLMEKNFAEVQHAVKNNPALSDVRLIAMTMDPEHDTPDVLKMHAQGLGADPAIWSFVTAAPEDARKFAEQFGIHFERDEQNQWQLIHNLRTAIIAPDGTLVAIESGNSWKPADLVADLEKAPAPVN